MLSRAIDIRAQVQHHGSIARDVGNLTRQRGTFHPFEGFEQITGNRHECRRIPRRDGGLGATVFHLLDGNAHGGIFFLTQRDFQRIVHRDDLAGFNNGRAGVREAAHCLRQADHAQVCFGVLCEELTASGQSDLGAVIASHAIHSDGYHGLYRTDKTKARCHGEAASGLDKRNP